MADDWRSVGLERSLIGERTRAGAEAARKRGVKFGRQPIMTPDRPPLVTPPDAPISDEQMAQIRQRLRAKAALRPAAISNRA